MPHAPREVTPHRRAGQPIFSDIQPVRDDDDQMQRARTPQSDQGPSRVAGSRRARTPSPPARYPRDMRMVENGHDPTTQQSAGRMGPMTDYDYTFRLMTVRRLEREIQGTIAKARGSPGHSN